MARSAVSESAILWWLFNTDPKSVCKNVVCYIVTEEIVANKRGSRVN